jgi:hypothetical protein
MKVLTDYHHGGLFKSLHLMFEENLGWELYRPIGFEWFLSGYWKIAEPYGNAQDTINQYLSINDRVWDRYVNLNGQYKLDDDIYHVYDFENNFQHKAITFDKFKEMDFGLIVGSFPLHEDWRDFLKYHPKAKFVMQLGNENQQTNAKDIMCSVFSYKPEPGQNVFFYHQPFEKNNYYWQEPGKEKRITSFVILLPERELFLKYKDSLPDYDFKAYGPGAIDGNFDTEAQRAEVMRNSMFGWHVKPHDGYGHQLHSWYACGRPVITRGSYYEGKTGGMLLTDQETCIDLDKHSFDENIRLIKYWSEPENHIKMCQNALKRFNEVANFEDESRRFKDWISSII